MENRHQKSERSSEISYLKLENTRDVQTPQQGHFILKPEFLKHILQKNAQASKPIHHQYYKDNFNYQSDEEFLKEVFQIVEKHMSSLSQQQNKKQLEEDICDEIHEKCIRHRQANKFNMNTNYRVQAGSNNKKVKGKTDQKIDLKCFCGCGKYQGDPLPLCTDQLKYYFFGPLILVFFYLRKMITLLAIIALIYGAYSVVTNLILAPQDAQNICLIDPGMLSFLCPIKQHASTLNKLKTGYQKIQVWLGLLVCIVWLLSVRIIKSLGRSLNKKIDSLLDSSSDYVVQVENLPYNSYTQTQLLKYIASLWRNLKGNTKLPQIKSVQIIYQMDEPRKMIKDIVGNACKLSANLKKRVAGQHICHEIKQGQLESYLKCKMQLIKSIIKIQEYRSKFINDSQFRKQFATDIAFIQFNDSKDQAELLGMTKQYRITILGSIKQYITSKFSNAQNDSYIFKGNNIRITRAPEPSDISWLNCEKKNSYKRIALVWFISLLMVCISFGFLNFIRFLRINFENLAFMSILFSISLQAFNRIIWNTLISAVNLEQNNTNTDNVISIMSKGAFAQAINVLIIPLIFNYVMRDNLYGPQGLISSTLDYHFTFFFMQIFLNLINVPYMIRRISLFFPFIRNWVIRRYSNVVGVVDTGQEIKQVLSYYETPTFSIASVYTSTNSIIFHTMFYLHIQPLLIFTLIFNIMTVYFMQKYLFLRRYKIPELVDYIIFQNCFSYLKHVPLIYAAGSLTFIYLTEQTGSGVSSFNMGYIPSILCIVLWLINVTNPFSILNKFTKYVVNKLCANQNEVGQKQQGSSSQKMQEDIVKQNIQDNNAFVRRQSYYKSCGTNDLLQYQAKLTQILRDDEYQSINKIFCQRFSLKPSQLNQYTQYIKNSKKKNSMKLLRRMKQSFAMVKQDKPIIDFRKTNNRILPIDKFPLNKTFNQNTQLKSSIKVIQSKQQKSSTRNNNKQNALIIKQLKQNKQQNQKQMEKQKQQPIKQVKLYNQIQFKKQNTRIKQKQKQKIFNKPLTQRGQKQNSHQELQTKNRLVISSRPYRQSDD